MASTLTEPSSSLSSGRRRLPLGLLVMFSWIVCNPGPVLMAEVEDPVIHYPGGLIEFSRHCADEHPHTAQAYALFASDDGRARALFAPWVGYNGLNQEIDLGLKLEALVLDAGAKWASQPYALQFVVLTEDGQRLTGTEIANYHTSEPGTPPLQLAFTTTAEGQAQWLTFIEPDELEPDSDRTYRFAPSPHLRVSALGLQDHDASIQLAVAVQNLESSNEISMTGPSLKIPERVWSMKLPAHGVLYLAQALNPLQEGGVVRTVGRAWRYRNCIDERSAAKKEFHSFAASLP